MSDTYFFNSDIDDIIEWADEIAARWNGEESGRGEEKAQRAVNIIEKASELKIMISEMEGV